MGGGYIPRVELMLRSICARKTEASTGTPPRSDFLFCNAEDPHKPVGVSDLVPPHIQSDAGRTCVEMLLQLQYIYNCSTGHANKDEPGNKQAPSEMRPSCFMTLELESQ